VFDWFVKKITCTDSLDCSNQIVNALESSLGIKFRANLPTDKVNGFVSMWHEPNNHLIIVGVHEVSGKFTPYKLSKEKIKQGKTYDYKLNKKGVMVRNSRQVNDSMTQRPTTMPTPAKIRNIITNI